MKLIDLMVKENVQWPEGMECARQSNHRNTLKFFEYVQGIPVDGVEMKQLAVDWITAIVTREQYENAKAALTKKQTINIPSELDAEIERTLDAAEGDYSDETLAVINAHLDGLYKLKREWLRGELESKDTVTICTTEYAELLRNKVDSEPQLNITDWRDLREGDEIFFGGQIYTVTGVNLNVTFPVRVTEDGGRGNGLILKERDWRFISRPN